MSQKELKKWNIVGELLEIKGKIIIYQAQKLTMIIKNRINFDCQLNGECWTFYKFAILSAHTVSKTWLATHIEFYINENLCGGYGNADCDYYKMRYYADILKAKRIPVKDVEEKNVVNTLIDEIDNTHYVVIYVDYKALFSLESSRLHELLVYGYDDVKRVFYCPMLENGRFIEKEIPFSVLAESYSSARELYMQDGWTLLMHRSYYFGITSLEVNKDYINDNCIADLIDKIDHEIGGMKITQVRMGTDEQQERVCHTGNACFAPLVSYIESAIREDKTDKSVFSRIIRTLKMMFDFRMLMLFSIKWFSEYVNAKQDENLQKIYNDYESCAYDIQKTYLLLLKTEYDKKTEHYNDALSILSGQREKEKAVLERFREAIWSYYYDLNGVPMPPEE